MKKAFLIILDGWGLGKVKHSDAILAANTPVFDGLMKNNPNSTLVTYGKEVGLPEGQMGNSEVGHLNIGAGRIVFQELARINNSIDNSTLQKEAAIKNLMAYCLNEKRPLHLMGLLSDGGVHSHIDHLLALIEIFEEKGLEINLHLFLDGRDTDPKNGVKYIQTVLDHCKNKNASLTSIIGRYYAMDRDQRWERIKKAYDLIVKGIGQKTDNIVQSVQEEYKKGVTDEFMPPFILDKGKCISDKEAVLFFNFRTDRPRQITRALTQEDFKEYGMHKLKLHFTTMTNYSDSFNRLNVVFEKTPIPDTLGQVISDQKLTQVRIAETEKYPHVTFFFSGGKEEAEIGEKRILIPSPKVATYDMQPEMSAQEVTESIIEEIMSNQPDFICLNYANADMVGHTGDFRAAKKACETVDACLGNVVEVAKSEKYEIVVIADHGNSDYMINENGTPNTAHTTNLVPMILISQTRKILLNSGKLADVAPTILELMGITAPKNMTGNSLIKNQN